MEEVLLRSALLDRHGFAHGFSLRTGGVSAPPFDTLNLGRNVGDAPEQVQANHERFAQAAGFSPAMLHEVSQVHGADVRVIRARDDVEATRREKADAMVTDVPQRALGVRVADCVPLLLGDLRGGAVAAVHAGWRGCVAGVIDRAVEALCREAGTDAQDLVAALGPHIRSGAFEVGDDVAEQLAEVADASVVIRPSGRKPRVDLSAVVRARLMRGGVLERHIDDVGGCTFAEPERFFSYRRDGPRSGRHVGAIRVRSE